jgi:putative MATE family efflux protein
LNVLSARESKRRERILNGPLWSTVLWITGPLALYAFFNFLYMFFDIVIVATIGNAEVASVVFIDEIKTAFLAFGGGIAAGGSVIVARHYGANRMEEAKQNAAASFLVAFLFAAVVAGLLVLLGEPFLRLFNAPEEVIETGMGYFNVQILSTALMAINAVYFGIEKAKGNSSIVLYLNVVSMLLKLALSVLFVFGLGKGTTHVALATLFSQAFLTIIALGVLFSPKNSLSIEWKKLSLDWTVIKPIVLLALPVMAGKFLFSMGKVIVNGMAAFYGTAAVAALGVAIKVTQGANSIPLVFEESETAIISQNLGAGKLKRAFGTYAYSAVYAVLIGLVGMTATLLMLDWLVNLFATSADPVYRQMIVDIYHWEKFSTYTSAGIAIITGVFIGFKMTNVSFLLNVVRLFVFRIPLLFALQKLGVGYLSLGYIMFFSNLATTIVAAILLYLFYRKVKAYGYLGMRLDQDTPISSAA